MRQFYAAPALRALREQDTAVPTPGWTEGHTRGCCGVTDRMPLPPARRHARRLRALGAWRRGVCRRGRIDPVAQRCDGDGLAHGGDFDVRGGREVEFQRARLVLDVELQGDAIGEAVRGRDA